MAAASTFLTADELATLTGYKIPRGQRQWLTKQGWVFVENRSRRPIVSRSYADRRLGGTGGMGADYDAPAAVQPNFDAIR